MGIIEQVDRFLWRRGFFSASLRTAIRNLFFCSAIIFSAGAVGLPWNDFFFWTGTASFLSCWNFYTLALFIQQAVPASIPAADRYGEASARVVKKGLLLRSQLRLCITGFLVYIAVVVFQASPAALAAGLSATVVIIPVSLFFQR